jgi:hypothetical protein
LGGKGVGGHNREQPPFAGGAGRELSQHECVGGARGRSRAGLMAGGRQTRDLRVARFASS